MAQNEDELEESGSDLEQMIAMLEKAEIDYDKDDDEDGMYLVVNGEVRFLFNEDGDLEHIGHVN